MMKRITITISEETEVKLKQKKPTYLSLSKFINMILESNLDNLDRVARLPVYRVGAEEISTKLDTNISTPINEEKVHLESSNSSLEKKFFISLYLFCFFYYQLNKQYTFTN